MTEPINRDELVDICTIHIDKNLPRHERILAFVRQIKNPYLHLCGEFVVTSKYAKNGPTIEACMQSIIRH